MKTIKDVMHGKFLSVSRVGEIITVPMLAKMAANLRTYGHAFFPPSLGLFINNYSYYHLSN